MRKKVHKPKLVKKGKSVDAVKKENPKIPVLGVRRAKVKRSQGKWIRNVTKEERKRYLETARIRQSLSPKAIDQAFA